MTRPCTTPSSRTSAASCSRSASGRGHRRPRSTAAVTRRTSAPRHQVDRGDDRLVLPARHRHHLPLARSDRHSGDHPVRRPARTGRCGPRRRCRPAAWNSVRTKPGQSAIARTPVPASDAASALGERGDPGLVGPVGHPAAGQEPGHAGHVDHRPAAAGHHAGQRGPGQPQHRAHVDVELPFPVGDRGGPGRSRRVLKPALLTSRSTGGAVGVGEPGGHPFAARRSAARSAGSTSTARPCAAQRVGARPPAGPGPGRPARGRGRRRPAGRRRRRRYPRWRR